MRTATRIEEIPALAKAEAMALAGAEYRRLEEALRALSPEDWATPTPDCPMWDVRAMVAHVIGGCAACASMRETFRQMRGAKRVLRDPSWKDPTAQSKMHALNNAMNELQIRERAHLSPAELLRAYAEAHPRAVTGRARKPRALGALKMKGPEGGRMSPLDLYRCIYTRDTWMHRMDIARATGRAPQLTAEHDGRIVAHAVAEWARMHGAPFALDLTGPAGGTFAAGSGGAPLALDAVEFCRITSGRAPGEGLLSTRIPW